MTSAMMKAAVTFTALAALAACSSKSDGGTGGASHESTSTTSGSAGSTAAGTGGHDCGLYMVPAGTDLTMPVEKFSTNVMQIFSENCSSAPCHGASPGTGGLTLGSTAAETAATYKALVNVMSGELTSMPYVTPGKPDESYLMHKLDADQCYYDEQCVGHMCLASMPNLGTSLPVATRDIVRRWIAQGAMNN